MCKAKTGGGDMTVAGRAGMDEQVWAVRDEVCGAVATTTTTTAASWGAASIPSSLAARPSQALMESLAARR